MSKRELREFAEKLKNDPLVRGSLVTYPFTELDHKMRELEENGLAIRTHTRWDIYLEDEDAD